MSVKIMSMVWDAFPASGSELLCMLAMADWANDVGGSLHPSMRAIAEKVRVSEKQARRIVQGLVSDGYLSVVGNAFGGVPGTTKQWAINVKKLKELVAKKEAEEAALVPSTEGQPLPPMGAVPLPPMGAVPLPPMGGEGSHPWEGRAPTHGSLTTNEPPLNTNTKTHTTGNGACEGESAGVCVDHPVDASVSQTLPGMVCKAMKAEGIADPNPGHAKLLALLQAGAEMAEFTSAAAEAVQRKKGFAYALGMVANRRKEAAAMAASGMHQGAMAASQPRNAEPAWRTEQRSRMQQACPRIAAKDPAAAGAFDPSTTIDVEAHHVPAIALG